MPRHNWRFLSDVPAQALQQSLKNLERAYTNFFEKRADFPKFKKKGQRESFRIPQGFALDNQNGRVQVPKMGWMRYRKSQEVLGEAKNLTLRESCGKWYVSVQTERDVETPKHPSTSAVGMDWGVVHLATLSGHHRGIGRDGTRRRAGQVPNSQALARGGGRTAGLNARFRKMPG